MTIWCVIQSDGDLNQAYFTEAEADAAALLILGSTVEPVSLSPSAATPPDMYVDEIITALQTVIATAGGIALHKDAYALDELEIADLPAAIYEFRDFVDTPDSLTEKYCTQAYQINVTIVCKHDVTNTATVGRAVAVAARNAIKAVPALGLGAAYVARPRRVTTENQMQEIFRAAQQPRQAFLIEVIVMKQETEP